MTCQTSRFANWTGLLVAASMLISGCGTSPASREETPRESEQSNVTSQPDQTDDSTPPVPTLSPPTDYGVDLEPAPEPAPDEQEEPSASESIEQDQPDDAAEQNGSEQAPQESEPPSDDGGPSGEDVSRSAVDDHSESAPGDPTARLAALSDAFREVARNVKPSVVQVAAEVRPGAGRRPLTSRVPPEQRDEFVQRYGPLLELDPELQQFFRGRQFEEPGPDYDQYNVPLPVGSASGWIYDEQGHVITNHHVVAKADQITLTFSDDSEAKAVVVGSDPQTDIAVLKTQKPDLHAATLAAQGVEQGDIVLAVGSPFRYAFSVSQGIVSAKDRRMGILGPHGYENFIQTDAAINPGNSGGPLTNARGEVVGMNTAIASRSGAFAGIGFAIPADMIRDVANELIRKGKVERGYLGVMISDDPRLLASFGAQRGVLVEDLVDDGPADRAGLKAGDIITRFDQDTLRDATDLRRHVARTDPGQTVQLGLYRDGQTTSLEVTLEGQPVADNNADSAARPPQSPDAPDDSVEAEALAKLGFERLQVLTPDIAQQYGLDPSRGIVVLAVRPFSSAATAGLQRGHIITHVEGQAVEDIDALRQAVEGKDLPAGVRLRVKVPGGPARFVLLSLDE